MGGLTEAELLGVFDGRGDRRAVSLVARVDGGPARFDVLWGSASVEQRAEVGVAPEDAELVAKRWAAKGFEPHLVAMTGAAPPRVAIVFERSLTDRPARVLAGPRPLRDAAGRLFTATVAELGSCTWIAAAGTPADASGRGVTVASIHAVDEPHRVGWSVHVHRLDGGRAFEELPEVRVLASVGRCVVAAPLRGTRGEDFVVSLFRDERVERGRVAPRSVAVREATGPATGGGPIDDWMVRRMRECGARHAQLAIVRGEQTVYARAFTFAEGGYPNATLDHAMRLGSVSKAITALALFRALRERRPDLALDVEVAPLLDLEGRGPPGLASVTIADLLLHRSGLGSFPDMAPAEADNPLSEAKVAALLGRARAHAGDLREALARTRESRVFAPRTGSSAYSNEGFILLGELLSRIELGRYDGFHDVIERLFRGAGIDTEGRGVLAASTREEAAARGESPVHGSSPGFGPATFEQPFPPVELAHATHHRFLGGAAGISVPVLWVARLFGRVLAAPPGDALSGLLSPCIDDLRVGARATYGFYAGEPGWSKARGAGGSATYRTVCLHHNGRVEGGSSLLMIRAPIEPRPEHPALTIVAAMNQLGDLYEDPHGRELLAILRRGDGVEPG